jgi:hypothetical protein
MISRRGKVLGALAMTLLLAPGLVGCSNTDHGTPIRGTRNYAIDVLNRQARQGGGSRAFVPRRLSEILPTVTYHDGSAHIHESTVVVTGHFVSSREVPALVDSEEPDAGHLSPAWRIGYFDFLVDQKITGNAQSAAVNAGATLPVEIYLPVDANVDRMGEGLRALGRTVAFLKGGFPGDRTWGIAGDGSLLAPIDSTDTFRMQIAADPGDHGDVVDGMLVDLHSLSDIRRSASTPRTLDVLPDGTFSAARDRAQDAPSTSPSASSPGGH